MDPQYVKKGLEFSALAYTVLYHRTKENSNREIAFCYKFMLTKGKKFLLNKAIEEKRNGTVRKKRSPCRKLKERSDQIGVCLQNWNGNKLAGSKKTK